MPRQMTKGERQEFLDGPHVAVLSVARGGDRPPHTTPVWYAYEPGGEVTFFTGTQGRRSRKADLVREAGRLSLTVQREDFPYGYVTVEGSVVGEERPPSFARALAVARRYMPEEQARGFVEAEIGHPAGEFVLFRVRPDRWLTFDFADEAREARTLAGTNRRGVQMTNREPVAELDARFSSEEATAREWSEGRQHLERAEIYWISTVRPDGRPHVTPLIAVWLDDALYFCTGPDERKARNLAQNPYCVVTTGSNALGEGFDVVAEGTAVRVSDDDRLRGVAGAYLLKYGDSWRFAVRDGAFYHDTGSLGETGTGAAWVFEVSPTKVFGFGKGELFSQTRWRF